MSILVPYAGASPEAWEAYRERLYVPPVVREAVAVSETVRVVPPDILQRIRLVKSPRRPHAGSSRTQKAPAAIDAIIHLCAWRYNVKVVDILAGRRSFAIIRPRFVAIYLSLEFTLCSLPEIGRRFGGRDHSTIINSVRRTKAMMASDPDFEAEVGALYAVLAGVWGNAQ